MRLLISPHRSLNWDTSNASTPAKAEGPTGSVGTRVQVVTEEDQLGAPLTPQPSPRRPAVPSYTLGRGFPLPLDEVGIGIESLGVVSSGFDDLRAEQQLERPADFAGDSTLVVDVDLPEMALLFSFLLGLYSQVFLG